MLYHLLYPLHVTAGLHGLNVVRDVSTSTIPATLPAMEISFLRGRWFTNRLRSKQIGEIIRTDGPQTHKKKAGTPTMGGSLILFCLTVSTLLWCDLRSPLVWLALSVTVAYGAIGFADDYMKLAKRNKDGISGKLRLFL